MADSLENLKRSWPARRGDSGCDYSSCSSWGTVVSRACTSKDTHGDTHAHCSQKAVAPVLPWVITGLWDSSRSALKQGDFLSCHLILEEEESCDVTSGVRKPCTGPVDQVSVFCGITLYFSCSSLIVTKSAHLLQRYTDLFLRRTAWNWPLH